MTTPPKGRIFISYRRVDSEGYAGRIYDRLAPHFGADAIFMDVDDIPAGVDFVKFLENEVRSCDVLIALMGRQWLNVKDEHGNRRLDDPKDFVRIEIETALKRDIRVIPVLLGGTEMPQVADLPENLQTITRRNGLPIFHHSFHADTNRLIKNLEDALAEAEAEESKNFEKIEQKRILEAAIEKEIVVNRATQLYALIRREEGKGIIDLYPDIDAEADINEDDIKSRPIHLEFPVRRGETLPAKLQLCLVAPDFDIIGAVQDVVVPPDGDTEPVIFTLTPKFVGELELHLEIRSYGLKVGSKIIRTNVVDTNKQVLTKTLFSFSIVVLVHNYPDSQNAVEKSLEDQKEKEHREKAAQEMVAKAEQERTAREKQQQEEQKIKVAVENAFREQKQKEQKELRESREKSTKPVAKYANYKKREHVSPIKTWLEKIKREFREKKIAQEKAQQRAQAIKLASSPIGIEWIKTHAGVEWVKIPAGEFTMGGNDYGDEKPPHQVHVKGYWIGKTPVTNAQFEKFIATGGYFQREYWTDEGWLWLSAQSRRQPPYWSDVNWNEPMQPVVGVTWYEAVAFCSWINCRLPNEAEWEKAARGIDKRRYPWGDKTPNEKLANSSNKIGKTTPVGKYSPAGDSPYGCQDMAGNVWEWTSSLYKSYPYNFTDGRKNLTSIDKRVLRGGAWDSNFNSVRSSYRNYKYRRYEYSYIGFRCAKDAD